MSGAGRVQRGMPAFSSTLAGGAVALFVDIPLTSPDDRLGNTGSVAAVSVMAALILGWIWAALPGDTSQRARAYSRVCLALFALTVVAALLAESVGGLANVVSYVVPLAAIVCVATALLTPLVGRMFGGTVGVWIGVSLLAAVLVTGVTLAVYRVGFTEPPSLSLPPPP